MAVTRPCLWSAQPVLAHSGVSIPVSHLLHFFCLGGLPHSAFPPWASTDSLPSGSWCNGATGSQQGGAVLGLGVLPAQLLSEPPQLPQPPSPAHPHWCSACTVLCSQYFLCLECACPIPVWQISINPLRSWPKATSSQEPSQACRLLLFSALTERLGLAGLS